ncbi:hypothetical protein AMECASPLE_027884 [Ameca splendens]|uniref:Uncharacterized protein n=1 Tax=Ameca splendens TaxID=208324 RepID=A0ABV0YTP9_9TELE
MEVRSNPDLCLETVGFIPLRSKCKPMSSQSVSAIVSHHHGCVCRCSLSYGYAQHLLCLSLSMEHAQAAPSSPSMFREPPLQTRATKLAFCCMTSSSAVAAIPGISHF